MKKAFLQLRYFEKEQHRDIFKTVIWTFLDIIYYYIF